MGIAIVGASELGRKLAYEFALAGYRTILEDISPSTLEQGIAWIAEALRDAVSRGEIGAAAHNAALANLSTANTPEDASREADLIIEAVADEIEMKIELFTIFDKFAKPGAIFASTTTSLSITDLAAITFCPERCIGMHFFTDQPRVKRLELVRGLETSGDTIAACREVGRRIGREVSVTTDQREFATGCPECGAADPSAPAGGTP
ncbi:MAG TPA: 3-hydroxyacyl-CoA dehydrogenase NAD-binding domain-containing protein [Candidatus Acidoferrum sp.]|jgi:3-hydroxybutyryl-CoA dehydrogenase